MVSSEKYQVDCFSPLSYRLPGRSIPPSLGSKAARLSQLFENAKVCLGFFATALSAVVAAPQLVQAVLPVG